MLFIIFIYFIDKLFTYYKSRLKLYATQSQTICNPTIYLELD